MNILLSHKHTETCNNYSIEQRRLSSPSRWELRWVTTGEKRRRGRRRRREACVWTHPAAAYHRRTPAYHLRNTDPPPPRVWLCNIPIFISGRQWMSKVAVKRFALKSRTSDSQCKKGKLCVWVLQLDFDVRFVFYTFDEYSVTLLFMNLTDCISFSIL